MPNPTNFTKNTPSPSRYNIDAATLSFVLLLQNGKKLLLQNGVSNLLLQSGSPQKRINFSAITIRPTGYS